MNTVRVLFTVILAGGILAGCAPKGEPPEQMIAAAKELDKAFLEAYNKGDIDGVMATYWNSPELVSYPPGAMEFRGWENVKAKLTEEFAMPQRGTLALAEPVYKVIGDVVIGYGKWRYTIPIPNGEPITIDGRYTGVTMKKDGKWVVVHDHASAPMPPPPEAP